MAKTKNILAMMIVAVIGTVIFWKRDWLKDKLGLESLTQKKAEPAPNNVLAPPPSIPGVDFNNCESFPLKLGCSGSKIKALQKALNRNFNANIQVDGHFGTATERALENAGFGKELTIFEVSRVML